MEQYYKEEIIYNNEGNDANFNIVYMEQNLSTKDDLKQFFTELNNNFNSTDMIIIENELDAREAIKTHIQFKYKKHISHSSKPRYPNINLDTVVRYFLDTHGRKDSNGIYNYDRIINILEDVNNDLKNKVRDIDPDKYDDAEKKGGLFLAYLFTDTDKKSTSKGRKSIPNHIRKKLWEQTFLDEYHGTCEVCNCKINKDEFHCGHVKAVAKGGTDSLNNLRPVCAACNLGMGTENMNSYKKRFYS
jgi:hypothetical protein